MSPGDRHFSVNEGIAGMDCRVSIDSATGIVRSYQRVHRKEELNAPKDPSTITRSDVFPLILPITKQYGLSEDSSGYEIREVSASGGFSVHKMLDYQGVPCRNSRLYVGIGANGKVEVLWYDPVIVPAEPTKTIPVTEAISAVQQWLKSLEYFRDKDARIIEDAEAKCQKVIAGPNKFFQKREMQASDALRSEEAYYSWEVPFTFTEHGHDLTVRAWVNVETGEVIGAY